MKKKNVLNLIRYHVERNDDAFRTEAYEIAYDFRNNGEEELADYIFAQLSDVNTFVNGMVENRDFSFFHEVKITNEPLPLPESISNDISGIINAIRVDKGINKYLFYGQPGKGKTEAVKQIARILGRDLFMVDFEKLLDEEVEQTILNIHKLFDKINEIPVPNDVIILFEKIETILFGENILAISKKLDNLNPKVVIIATSDLFESLDKEIIKRFDKIISFDRYTREDLEEIAEIILNYYLAQFKNLGKNLKVFKKILKLKDTIPNPGELKKIIKTSIAFSNLGDEFDYLRRFYLEFLNIPSFNLQKLKEQGFTLREMELFTKISKSQIDRNLKIQKL